MRKSLFFITLLMSVLILAVTISASTPSDWAIEEVTLATEMGLSTEKTSADYQKDITREEFCELVVKLHELLSGKTAEIGKDIFEDTDNAEILKAYKLGIVNGVSDTEFAPNSPITRQEICTMLTRCVDVSVEDADVNVYNKTDFIDSSKIADWALSSVNYAYDKGIMKGVADKEINPLGNTTCEQAVLLVYRTYQIEHQAKDGEIEIGDDVLYTPNEENIVTDEDAEITFVNNMILIYFEDNVPKSKVEDVVSSIGGTIVGWTKILDQYQVEVKSGTLADLLVLCQEVEEYDCVMSASLDVFCDINSGPVYPDDAEYSKQGGWIDSAINLSLAWSYNDYFAKNFKIGIVDCGFDNKHEDLDLHIYSDSNTAYYHGTHVAGIIGATPNNKTGVAGIVWSSELLCYSHNKADRMSTSETTKAVKTLVENGAKVVNVSLGNYYSSWNPIAMYYMDRDANSNSIVVGKLLKHGYDFVIVQSAGNGKVTKCDVDGDGKKEEIALGVDAQYVGPFACITRQNGCNDDIDLDAVLKRIIVVGAAMPTNDGYMQAPFSNGGNRIDICAPGVSVYSTLTNNEYGYLDGTSMAAPIVSGVSALVWAANPSLTGADVKRIVCDEKNTKFNVVDNPLSPDAVGDFRMVNAKMAVEASILEKETNEKLGPICGTYEGTYLPSQGETALTLVVYKNSLGDYIAIFKFKSLPGETNSLEGSYYMDVTYDEEKDCYVFTPTKWIKQPTLYKMLPLVGKFKSGILFGAHPTKFKITKISTETGIH